MNLRTLHGLWGAGFAASTMSGRLVGANYAPRIRAERLIATSRVVLAVFALLAVWLDPYTPVTHAQETYLLLLAYVSYALVVASIVWLAHGPLVRLGLVTHVLDLLLFSLLTYLTEGPTSPFFTYFTFAIVAATLRWQWRGALWTSAAALVTFNGIGIFGAEVMNDPAFEENRFVIRSVYLAVMAGLLGYLGAYEERRRREMSELAAWPPHRVGGSELPQPEVIESAARILGARRVVLAWEEPDEPWLHLASWCDGEFRSWREAPETFQPVVAEPLADLTFLSKDVRAPVPIILHHAEHVPRGWRGAPIHPALQSRFLMTSVLCLPIRGECLEGHLFALDKPHMTGDDLLLGEIVAHEVASSMDQSLLSRRLRQTAAADERMRLSRDLHDGVLQSLTGAALQLETVQRLWDTEPAAARERLAAIQRLIVDEQRDLRFLIRVSKLAPFGMAAGNAGLNTTLRQLVTRLEGLWGLQVELHLERLDDRSSDAVAYDICFIVQEALVNAARHASASEVRVAVGRENGNIHVAVTDNGRGFPFEGDYDHVKLDALQLGPVMLKDRVRSLGGTLAIHSTPSGARLDIRLPRAHGDG
jgi:signal transduction histidine kinase